MRTVLGNELIGWTDFPDNQLLRCPQHKKYEAGLLLNFPLYYAYLDVGSHYGDTVLTLALYAKKWDRNDIRFFAFEPNKRKCQHIKKISRMNKLNIMVYNNCVGNNNYYASSDGSWDERLGCCSYISLTIPKVKTPNVKTPTAIKTIKLNDIYEILGNVGLMHIDTEGWEPEVLKGATNVLKNTIYLIAECWTNEQSITRGFSEDPESEIINNINEKYKRLDDIIDCERNLVFKL